MYSHWKLCLDRLNVFYTCILEKQPLQMPFVSARARTMCKQLFTESGNQLSIGSSPFDARPFVVQGLKMTRLAPSSDARSFHVFELYLQELFRLPRVSGS